MSLSIMKLTRQKEISNTLYSNSEQMLLDLLENANATVNQNVHLDETLSEKDTRLI